MDNEKWIIVLLIMLWRMLDYSFFIIHYSLFIIHYSLLFVAHLHFH